MKCLLLVKEVSVAIDGDLGEYYVQSVEVDVPKDTLVSIEGYSFEWGDDPDFRIPLPVIDYKNIENLTGKVLTILDAVLANDERCHATKQLTKAAIKGWFKDIEKEVGTRLMQRPIQKALRQ